jgi:hypothetical protein
MFMPGGELSQVDLHPRNKLQCAGASQIKLIREQPRSLMIDLRASLIDLGTNLVDLSLGTDQTSVCISIFFFCFVSSFMWNKNDSMGPIFSVSMLSAKAL